MNYVLKLISSEKNKNTIIKIRSYFSGKYSGCKIYSVQQGDFAKLLKMIDLEEKIHKDEINDLVEKNAWEIEYQIPEPKLMKNKHYNIKEFEIDINDLNTNTWIKIPIRKEEILILINEKN